jgi:hypothetical protein
VSFDGKFWLIKKEAHAPSLTYFAVLTVSVHIGRYLFVRQRVSFS